MASALPAPVKQMLSEAKRYAEGRGIRVSVTSPGDISTITQLVKWKARTNDRERIDGRH